MRSISKGEHSSTFGGNPLACAAADATITALQEDGLIQNAANIGAMLIDGLKKLAETHPIIREVRGMGLMIGVELKFDVKDILMDAIDKGVLLLYSGEQIKYCYFVPLAVRLKAEAEIAVHFFQNTVKVRLYLWHP